MIVIKKFLNQRITLPKPCNDSRLVLYWQPRNIILRQTRWPVGENYVCFNYLPPILLSILPNRQPHRKPSRFYHNLHIKCFLSRVFYTNLEMFLWWVVNIPESPATRDLRLDLFITPSARPPATRAVIVRLVYRPAYAKGRMSTMDNLPLQIKRIWGWK